MPTVLLKSNVDGNPVVLRTDDTKVAVDAACCCACPTAYVACDAVSAGQGKCGWQEFTSPSTPPVFYCRRDMHEVFTKHNAPTCSCERDSYQEYGFSGGCATCGTGNATTSDTCHDGGGTVLCNAYFCDCNVAVSSQTQTVQVLTCNGAMFGSGSCTKDVTVTQSIEYTTANLKADVIAALPSFTGTFSSDCTSSWAVYNLSSDESSFTLQRFRYKLVILDSTACAGMVITWNEHFQPSPSGTPTDTPKSWTAVGGETESDIFTCPDPTTNGTTTITDVSVDCSDCP